MKIRSLLYRIVAVTLNPLSISFLTIFFQYLKIYFPQPSKSITHNKLLDDNNYILTQTLLFNAESQNFQLINLFNHFFEIAS